MSLDGVHARISEIKTRLEAYAPSEFKAASVTNNEAHFQDVLRSASAVAPNTAAMLDKVSIEEGLDPSLAKAVAKAESGFNPLAVSSAGAMGLMQLMPKTAQELGVKSILNPEENARGGVKYLKKLLNQFGKPEEAIAAYNAGPGAVDKYSGVPPYTETKRYVKKVLAYQQQYQEQGVQP
jgi:soluble lytic murein transglycosylase-like protein